MDKKALSDLAIVEQIRSMGQEQLTRLLTNLSSDQQTQLVNILQSAKLSPEEKQTIVNRVKHDVENLPELAKQFFKGLEMLSSAIEDPNDE